MVLVKISRKTLNSSERLPLCIALMPRSWSVLKAAITVVLQFFIFSTISERKKPYSGQGKHLLINLWQMIAKMYKNFSIFAVTLLEVSAVLKRRRFMHAISKRVMLEKNGVVNYVNRKICITCSYASVCT